MTLLNRRLRYTVTGNGTTEHYETLTEIGRVHAFDVTGLSQLDVQTILQKDRGYVMTPYQEPVGLDPDYTRHMVSVEGLLQIAARLKSEDGSNSEYDRALVEMIIEAVPNANVDDHYDDIADSIACRVPAGIPAHFPGGSKNSRLVLSGQKIAVPIEEQVKEYGVDFAIDISPNPFTDYINMFNYALIEAHPVNDAPAKVKYFGDLDAVNTYLDAIARDRGIDHLIQVHPVVASRAKLLGFDLSETDGIHFACRAIEILMENYTNAVCDDLLEALNDYVTHSGSYQDLLKTFAKHQL